MAEIQQPQVLYEGRYCRLVRQGRWEFVKRRDICGIVGILAVTPDGRMVLVEQYRAPVGARVVEIPAGLAGDGGAGEDLAQAAVRELEEETGWRACKMTLLGSGAASAGITDEIITLYRAEGLVKVGAGGGDDSENITVHEVPLEEVEVFLAACTERGAVIDMKVYAALFFAKRTP